MGTGGIDAAVGAAILWVGFGLVGSVVGVVVGVSLAVTRPRAWRGLAWAAGLVVLGGGAYVGPMALVRDFRAAPILLGLLLQHVVIVGGYLLGRSTAGDASPAGRRSLPWGRPTVRWISSLVVVSGAATMLVWHARAGYRDAKDVLSEVLAAAGIDQATLRLEEWYPGRRTDCPGPSSATGPSDVLHEWHRHDADGEALAADVVEWLETSGWRVSVHRSAFPGVEQLVVGAGVDDHVVTVRVSDTRLDARLRTGPCPPYDVLGPPADGDWQTETSR